VFDKHPLSLFLVVLSQRKMDFFQTKHKKIKINIFFFLYMAKNPKVIYAFFFKKN
jgi:hypothetical protein